MEENCNRTIDKETNMYYHILKRQDIIKFTYEDYLQCLAERSIYAKEEQAEYKLIEGKGIHQEYDKTYKMLLNNPKNAVSIINRALKLDKNNQINPEEIEKYETNFITNQFKSRQADIVYKLKNDNIYFLIEHQSRPDYSIGYRIREYKIEITKSAIDVKKLKTKGYKIPYVVAIVLYTGNKKWKVSLYLEENENIRLKNINELKYNLVDINKLDREELLGSNNLIDKVLLMKKEEDKQKTIEIIEKIIPKVKTKEDKENLIRIITVTMEKKIGRKKLEEIIQKVKGGKEKMYDSLLEDVAEHVNKVFERDEREMKKRERKEGRKEGRKESQVQIVKKMKENDFSVEIIETITGLSKEEIKKIS